MQNLTINSTMHWFQKLQGLSLNLSDFDWLAVSAVRLELMIVWILGKSARFYLLWFLVTNIRLTKLVLNHVRTLSPVLKKPEFSNCWWEVQIGRPITLQTPVSRQSNLLDCMILPGSCCLYLLQGFLLRCHYSDRTGKSPFVEVSKRFQICNLIWYS